MLGACATHSLRIVIAATVLLAIGDAMVLAQSLTVPQPEPPPESTVKPLSLFDNRLVSTKSKLDSWLAGTDMICIGCGLFDPAAARPDNVNATAPWVLRGTWGRQTRLGTISAGFIGVRNSAMPLSTLVGIGGKLDRDALRTAPSTSFAPFSRWGLTAAVEKTMWKRKGVTFGFTADALVPVAASSTTSGDPRAGGLSSATIRAGFVFRW